MAFRTDSKKMLVVYRNIRQKIVRVIDLRE